MTSAAKIRANRRNALSKHRPAVVAMPMRVAAILARRRAAQNDKTKPTGKRQ